jgi:hypothetical protein
MVAMFGARRRAEDLEIELARTRTLLQQLGGLDDLQRAQRRQQAELQLGQVLRAEHAARERVNTAHRELNWLQSQLIETREAQLLQEAGVYDYTHPLDSAVAYKDRLTRLRADIKAAVTGRRAVTGSVDWTVNGSRTQGAKMIKDFSTLMLRAYNAEADNCVRTVKPHTLASVVARLEKTRSTIARLGSTMSIAIAEPYYGLRRWEIELTPSRCYFTRLEQILQAGVSPQASAGAEVATDRHLEFVDRSMDKMSALSMSTVAAAEDRQPPPPAASPGRSTDDRDIIPALRHPRLAAGLPALLTDRPA